MVSFFFFLGKRKKEKGINWLIMRTKNSTQADLMDCIFMIKLKIVAKPEPTKLRPFSGPPNYQTKILWICSRKTKTYILTVAGSRRQPARLKTSLRQENKQEHYFKIK
jgi:hypothetical protein